jgi:hypothetical protein
MGMKATTFLSKGSIFDVFSRKAEKGTLQESDGLKHKKSKDHITGTRFINNKITNLLYENMEHEFARFEVYAQELKNSN